MLLGELEKVRKQLSETIRLHGDTLRKSESATRYALIDPISKSTWLGFDRFISLYN